MFSTNNPTKTITRVVVIKIVKTIAQRFLIIKSKYVITPTKSGMKNKIIYFNKKLQKSSTNSSFIIFNFKREKRTIIPKIGAGKYIFVNFRK